jgi:hypothetical protein
MATSGVAFTVMVFTSVSNVLRISRNSANCSRATSFASVRADKRASIRGGQQKGRAAPAHPWRGATRPTVRTYAKSMSASRASQPGPPKMYAVANPASESRYAVIVTFQPIGSSPPENVWSPMSDTAVRGMYRAT